MKLDDGFPEHPKVEQLSDRAFRLHVTALCSAQRSDTKGFISLYTLRRLGVPNPKKIASGLVAAGLWDEEPGGYQIHDFTEYNPPRDARSDAARNAARIRWGNAKGNAKRNAETMPIPNPNPTQPENQKQISAPLALVEARFSEFYDAYPRKRARGQALKAYRSALKKATPAIILEGLERALPEFSGRSPDKIPYPASWLNGEGWLDESDPSSFEARLARGERMLGVVDG